MGQEHIPPPKDGRSAGNASAPAGSSGLDETKYQSMIADWECSDEQKSEFLRALWQIMNSFVDLGFGVDSITLLFPDLFENPSDHAADMVQSNNIPDTNNAVQCAPATAQKDESGHAP